ncbi:activating transcription factor 7-interacting protein 1-like [Lineus longissimus]|uniref:activating transcription factor 7-interacting protein 1-like n=1 Tax=Lineus longissimus TaxID=88925 RepID=UPI00315D5B99
MSGGSTAVVTMRPDETPLNGDANHSFSSMKDEVVNLLKHEVGICRKNSDKNDLGAGLKLDSSGDGKTKDILKEDVNNSDEPVAVAETNGHSKVAKGETKLCGPGEAGNGDNGGSRDVEGAVKCVESNVKAKDEKNEPQSMEVDKEKAPSINGDHGNGDHSNCNQATKTENVESTAKKEEESKIEQREQADSDGIDSNLKNGNVKNTVDANFEVELEVTKTKQIKSDEELTVGEKTDANSQKREGENKNSLSIRGGLKTSVSELVKKAVESVKLSSVGSNSSFSMPFGTTTPPVEEADDMFHDAEDKPVKKMVSNPDSKLLDNTDQEMKSEAAKESKKIDSDLDSKLLGAPDQGTKSEAAKNSNVTNCDKDANTGFDACEDIPESLLDEDERPGVTSATRKEADDEEINEDELLMELDSDKQAEGVEPDASLLNESDHEDQSKTVDQKDASVVKENDSSVVVLLEDEDARSEEKVLPTRQSVESAKTSEPPPSESKVEEKMGQSSDNLDIPKVEVVTPSAPLTAAEELKAKIAPDVAKKKLVEDVDSDYEVMEISLDDIEPGVKNEATRSASAIMKSFEDARDTLSRKRAIPRSDADDATTGSTVKRTKRETETDAVVERSSRASTPDSVVCLPYAAPTKDAIKPVCDGNKKLITDKAFGELIRIKLNQCLMREIDSVVAPLRKRVSELQASNEAWKSQASELQKKILELNIALQRKDRKRKALKNDKAKAAHAKAAAAAAAASYAAVHNTPTKSPATTPKSPMFVSNVHTKPVQATTILPNSVRPLQIQQASNSSQYQTIQIPMSVSNQIRSVIGQPAIANVQLASASNAQLASQSTQNILQYNVNRGIIQGPFAPAANGVATSLPVRAVLDTTNSGTSLAGTPVPLALTNTVRSMLHTKREGQPTLVMMPNSTTQQNQVAQPTFLKVPHIQAANNANKNTNQKQVFVDLTDDDDPSSKKIAHPMPAGLTPNNTMTPITNLIRPAAAPSISPQSVAVPVRPGQITLRPGTQIVLNGSGAAPVFFQPLAQAQRISGPGTVQSKPPTFIYAPTSIQSQGNRVLTLLPQQQAMTTSTSLVSSPAIQTPRIVASTPQVTPIQTIAKHPAPLPPKAVNPRTNSTKKEPPKPALKISRVSQGIVLSWNMQMVAALYEEIASYQLYAYQETSSAPSTTLWKKVGDVKALPLPMACTLTQFQEGNRYHFAVRAIDVHQRVGPFSEPSSIHLTKNQS